MPPELSGFVCAYHIAAPGSSPKHAIYAFSFIVFVLHLSYEKNKNKQKEAGYGPFKKRVKRKSNEEWGAVVVAHRDRSMHIEIA